MMKQINIRPTSSVYGTYKRLSYHPWSAISEFVDNSTQSYFDHKIELLELPNFDNLKVEINYYSTTKGDKLEIVDNAFGMEIDDFERAIVLDSPPINKGGRNEFGMGLKTAACWFGKKWTVVSTQLNSDYEYSATIEVDKLVQNKSEEIDVIQRKVSKSTHYTKIIIENLNKKIMGKTISKVKDTLSSTYRQDIRNKEVSIYYNGVKLVYEDPIIYEEKTSSNEIKVWKKDIEFEVPYNDHNLRVYGFVALRIPGSVKDAGFTLFRRGRVIIGGAEMNYRPHEVFGDANLFPYQRIFGDLHLDDWPVTQAKDDFDWHDSALEETFINKLVEFTKDYRSKADSIRVRKPIDMNEVLGEAIKGFSPSEKVSLTIVDNNTSLENEYPESSEFQIFNKSEQNDINSQNNNNSVEQTIIADLVDLDDDLIINQSKYLIDLNFEGRHYKVTVDLKDNDISNWLVVEHNDMLYQVSINMRHKFFKPYVDKKEFSILIVRFVIALVLAEVEAYFLSPDGRVEPSDIRIRMNDLLREICDQDKLRGDYGINQYENNKE